MKKLIFTFGILGLIFGGQASATMPLLPPEDIIINPDTCTQLARDLYFQTSDRTTNGEVTKLQRFLADYEYLQTEPSGYFGVMTLKAVKDFQKSQGVNPTGYVGPLTRAKIKLVSCGGNDPISGSVSIQSVSGPTTLKVNEEGAWTIKATDSNNGQLTYFVDWGESVTFPDGRAGMMPLNLFVQTTKFSHRYAAAGTYNPTFYVRNASGQQISKRVTVKVDNSVSSNASVKVVSPNGGERLVAGSTHFLKWAPVGNTASPAKVDIFLQGSIWSFPVCPPGAVCPAGGPGPRIYVLDKNIPINSSYDWIVATDINNQPIPSGEYNLYVCPSGGSDSMYGSTCDSSDNSFSIVKDNVKVVSPNGGEKWAIGESRTIKTAINLPPVMTAIAREFTIKVQPYEKPCTDQICPMMARLLVEPYTIYRGWSPVENYTWAIGKALDGRSVPRGEYTVQVCYGEFCDVSDKPFTIIDPVYDANRAPVISGISGPTGLMINQEGTWMVNAYDPEGGPLSYSFGWCPVSGNPNMTCVGYASVPGQTGNNRFLTSFSTTGTYEITVNVTDAVGKNTTTKTTVRVMNGPLY